MYMEPEKVAQTFFTELKKELKNDVKIDITWDSMDHDNGRVKYHAVLGNTLLMLYVRLSLQNKKINYEVYRFDEQLSRTILAEEVNSTVKDFYLGVKQAILTHS